MGPVPRIPVAHSLTVALVASLLVHLLLVVTLHSGVADGLFPRVTFAQPDVPPPATGHPPPPQPSPLLLPPPEPPDERMSPEDSFDRLGARSDDGSAIKAAPGELPAILRFGLQDQPALSVDQPGDGQRRHAGPALTTIRAPFGVAAAASPAVPRAQTMRRRADGRSHEAPSDGTRPEPSVADAGLPTRPPDAGVAATGVDVIAIATRKIIESQPTSADPEPVVPAAPTALAMAPAAAPVQQAGAEEAPPVRSPSAGAAGAPVPQGDSTIDGFAATPPVEAVLRSGRVQARQGREFRFESPRLGEAAMVDLFGVPRRPLVLRIRIDPAGNVVTVDIAQPSGSTNLDTAFLNAAYAAWFQPRPDRAGVRGEAFDFTVRFVD